MMKIIKKLNTEFKRRKELNPRYSLRAYAKFLNLDVSILSRMMANKSKVSRKILNKLSVPLSITPEDYQIFENEILNESKKSKEKKKNIAIRQLPLEEIKIIQDWYHYVILELTLLDDFEPNSKWISKRLSISELDAELALERLLKLNLLIQNDEGISLATTEPMSELQDNFKNIAHRKRQKQVLQKAMDAMDLVNFQERDQSAITIALDESLIPEVKERIKKFRRSLANYIDKKSKTKNRVYELSISLFPWDNND